jgi:hypothetical protein
MIKKWLLEQLRHGRVRIFLHVLMALALLFVADVVSPVYRVALGDEILVLREFSELLCLDRQSPFT